MAISGKRKRGGGLNHEIILLWIVEIWNRCRIRNVVENIEDRRRTAGRQFWFIFIITYNNSVLFRKQNVLASFQLAFSNVQCIQIKIELPFVFVIVIVIWNFYDHSNCRLWFCFGRFRFQFCNRFCNGYSTDRSRRLFLKKNLVSFLVQSQQRHHCHSILPAVPAIFFVVSSNLSFHCLVSEGIDNLLSTYALQKKSTFERQSKSDSSYLLQVNQVRTLIYLLHYY